MGRHWGLYVLSSVAELLKPPRSQPLSPKPHSKAPQKFQTDFQPMASL